MRMNSWRLLLAAPAIALLGTGCITTRAVTATHWSSADTMYMAYVEQHAGTTTPKVMKCSRQQDNALACGDQAKLNEMLVPK